MSAASDLGETAAAELRIAELNATVARQQEVEKRTQQIQAAEVLLRSVLDSLDVSICILGADGVIVGANRLWSSLADRMGWTTVAAGPGGDFFALVGDLGPELTPLVAEQVPEVLAGRRALCDVTGWMGEEYTLVRVLPVHDHDEACAVVVVVDVTESARTQRELAEATERAQLLALVAEHTGNAVVITDVAGRIEWVNESFCRLNGYRPEEVIGRTRRELMTGPFTRTPAFRGFEESLVAGRPVDVEMPTNTKDGRTYWAHIQTQPIVVDGEVRRFVGIERDITTARGAVEQLRAATRRAGVLADELGAEKVLLSEVLGSIPHLVYWKGADLRYAGVNAAYLALRGLPDQEAVLERTETELGLDDALTRELTGIEAGVLTTGQAVENRRLVLASGERLLLSVMPQREADGRAHGVIGVAADVTHLSTLEQQVAQATRLESIGQLAAGIAHEINTPVQYVSDNTRFLADSFAEVLEALRAVETMAGESGPVAERLRAVVADLDLDFLAAEIPSALTQSLEGLDRVTRIVRAMKDFSHPGQGRVEADLNRALESTVQVSRNEWRYVAELDLDLDPAVGTVRCHEGELKQVLLNIVVNAAQAMSEERERTGQERLGRITMSTRRLEGGVRITIADDGPGMGAAVRAKIFDPFFTTKPVGKGTGQGLSMAYAVIVHQHGGTLTVDSEPGTGATFTIELPDEPPAD